MRFNFLSLLIQRFMKDKRKAASSQEQFDGLVGSRLEDAKKTDLFTWFCLTEIESVRKGPEYVTRFKPGGGKFRDLVDVCVYTDRKNRILTITLSLDRAFINDKNDSPFARDIAKSFLQSAFSRQEYSSIAELANEIEYRYEVGEPMVIRVHRPQPNLPLTYSLGYLTYLGKNRSFENNLSRSILRLKNMRTPDGNYKLHISAEVK
jgi:hypothetical protein